MRNLSLKIVGLIVGFQGCGGGDGGSDPEPCADGRYELYGALTEGTCEGGASSIFVNVVGGEPRISGVMITRGGLSGCSVDLTATAGADYMLNLSGSLTGAYTAEILTDECRGVYQGTGTKVD